jgi:hypothetical protein
MVVKSSLIIFVVVVAAMIITATATTAYAQGSATFDEIDESHEPLLSKILNTLLNHTADEVMIIKSGQMFITYKNLTPLTETTPHTTNSLLTSGVTGGGGDIKIIMPHNFAERNGYAYRDGTIYKPDGTELFP